MWFIFDFWLQTDVINKNEKHKNMLLNIFYFYIFFIIILFPIFVAIKY